MIYQDKYRIPSNLGFSVSHFLRKTDRGTVNYLEKKQAWPWQERLKMFISITNFVQFIHYNELIHKDLKLLNILIDSEGKPYITDFGISEQKACKLIQQNKYGTVKYSGEEFQTKNNMSLDDRSDIYSIAVILVELTLQRGIYQKEINQSVDLTREKGLLSDDALNFLQRMIDYSSKQVRPNAQEVNSFFEFEYYASCLYQYSEKSKYPNFSKFKKDLADKDGEELEIELFNKIWSEKRGNVIKEILPYYLNHKTKLNFYQIQLQVISNTFESGMQLNFLNFVNTDKQLLTKILRSFEKFKQFWGSVSFKVFQILLGGQESSKNEKLIETYQHLQYFFLKNIFSGAYSELLKTNIQFSIITISIKMLKEQNLINDFIGNIQQILEEIIHKDCELKVIEALEDYVDSCGFYKQSNFSFLFNEELHIQRSQQQLDIYLQNSSFNLNFDKAQNKKLNKKLQLNQFLFQLMQIVGEDQSQNSENQIKIDEKNPQQNDPPNQDSLSDMFNLIDQIVSGKQKQNIKSLEKDNNLDNYYEDSSNDLEFESDDLTLRKKSNKQN
ncbi:hypothetical protein ABPG72_006621 [Tetrahymena utriculariae]